MAFDQVSQEEKLEIVHDARRYQWLRMQQVEVNDGGVISDEELDELCDKGCNDDEDGKYCPGAD